MDHSRIIRNIEREIVIPVGLYHGYKKPKDINEFLEDLVQEASFLNEKGVVVGNGIKRLKIINWVCDAPARATITCTKQHTGYFSCSKCAEEGEWMGRVCFLKEDAEKRTDESFRTKQQEEHHNGTSCLEMLPIDMVADFLLDYMHLVCLGVMRKLLWAWKCGPVIARIGNVNVQRVSDFLKVVSEIIPRDFARAPEGLEELSRFKATELRQILLYTGPVILKGILPKEHYEHFLTLHVAIKILADRELCLDYNDYAKELLVSFVKNSKSLYGEQFVTYNTHNLIHLADEVRVHGHLDIISGFPFENFNHELKKTGSKTRQTTAPNHSQSFRKSTALKTKRAYAAKWFSFKKETQLGSGNGGL